MEGIWWLGGRSLALREHWRFASQDGWTPMRIAKQKGHSDVVAFLASSAVSAAPASGGFGAASAAPVSGGFKAASGGFGAAPAAGGFGAAPAAGGFGAASTTQAASAVAAPAPAAGSLSISSSAAAVIPPQYLMPVLDKGGRLQFVRWLLKQFLPFLAPLPHYCAP